MHVCFELIIPVFIQPDGLRFVRKSINWGGIDYPQKPDVYKWGDYLELLDYGLEVPKHIIDLLPPSHFGKNWKSLILKGYGLDMWWLEARGAQVEWGDNSLENLLHSVLHPINTWTIVFEWECDTIDCIKHCTLDESLEILRSNLATESPKGLLLLSKL